MPCMMVKNVIVNLDSLITGGDVNRVMKPVDNVLVVQEISVLSVQTSAMFLKMGFVVVLSLAQMASIERMILASAVQITVLNALNS